MTTAERHAGTVPRRRFRQRIVALLVCALGLAQLLTLGAGLWAARRNVDATLRAELAVAGSAFEHLYRSRFEQLGQSVQVLAADFGFRDAVASGDVPTVESALSNHAARAGAALAVLVRPDGELGAASGTSTGIALAQDWRRLLAAVRRDDYVAASVALSGQAYQMVTVPVMAPERIGWLLMGFRIDDALAVALREIAGLDVSFVGAAAQGGTFASTLVAPRRYQLARAARAIADDDSTVTTIEYGGEPHLVQRRELGIADGAVAVLLQKSVSAARAPYDALAGRLALLSMLVLAVAIAAGAGLARSMLRPLGQLARVASRIGEGDYRSPIESAGDDEFGQLAAALNVMRDEIAEREQRIVHQAHHDDLTGLPNRWLALDRVKGAIERARRSGGACAVALLDVARFKQINDTFGHHIGDVVLQEVAHRIVARARRADTVARLGGDDFLVLLEGADAAQATHPLAELGDSLSLPVDLEGMKLSLDVRMGLAAYPVHGEDAASLVRRAEIALYDAKASHARLEVYEPGRDEGHLRQLAIVATLPEALAAGQFALHYQPKLDLGSGSCAHAEALVRWIHPRFGFIPPDEFIQVIEQSGNISRLTSWIVDEAVRQARCWQDGGMAIHLSINLSTLDLLDRELPARFAAALARHGVDADAITLEVTESAVMRDPERARAMLSELRSTGLRLSIDDFGTGHSSLAQLKRLPVHELKIDKSFVLGLGPGTDDAAIVRSTIDLAHTLGLRVVAEGVETEASLTLLRELGCDVAQGYFISRDRKSVV